MPLIKRTLEPTQLSRSSLAPGVRNELECVTNNTLANVIRQLSSLSHHAEDMFSELYRDASTTFDRANHLQERVDRLKVKVTQLDSTVEEVSLQDITMRNPFKSSVIKDQQVVNVATRPRAIIEMYKQCDTPPPLTKLNPYREDGKDSMKFYTDPTYFFELWCQEITKDTEMQKKEYKRRKNKKPKGQGQRQAAQIREVKSRKDEYAKMAKGKEFVPEMARNAAGMEGHGRNSSRPNSLEIAANAKYLPPQGYGDGQVEPPPSYGMVNGGQPGGPQDPAQYNAAMAAYNNGGAYDPQDVQVAMMGATHPEMGSPMQSPAKRAVSGIRTPSGGGSGLNSPSRPSGPPPAPPGVAAARMDSPMGNRSGSASRESLPPPPPPPPGETVAARATPPYGSPSSTAPGARGVVIAHRHSPSPAKSNTPDADLPPPPSPPPVSHTPDTPGSMHIMPPPPPTPPFMQDNTAAAPPPPPPLPSNGQMPNGNVPQVGRALNPATLAVQIDSVSLTSNASSASGSTLKEEPKPPAARDERNDLLAAIRQGLNLRKVEERRVKEEQKKKQPTGLDVQSIMEAAFEMRRKALEANDSEEEEAEADSDVGWESEEET